jgi:hypothetical protein
VLLVLYLGNLKTPGGRQVITLDEGGVCIDNLLADGDILFGMGW